MFQRLLAMTVAAQKGISQQNELFNQAKKLRDLLLTTMDEVKDFLTIYSSDEIHQLPHTLALRINGIEGQWVMLECNRLGFAISYR